MKQMLDLEPKGEISNEVGSHPMCSLYTASLFKKLLEIQIEKPASCLAYLCFDAHWRPNFNQPLKCISEHGVILVLGTYITEF